MTCYTGKGENMSKFQSIVNKILGKSETTEEEKSDMSIYDKIGGEDAVNAAVDIFYRKVLMDERINEFFDTVDMESQHAKQKAFLTMAFGGPNNYTGKDMRESHKHMKLNEGHFNAVAENLVATLNELEVPQDVIGDIVAVCVSVKDDVLNVETETA